MNDILAIIVTYNRKKLLCECIDSLLSSNTTCDILIIDNNSTDGTNDLFKERYNIDRIRYYNTGTNLGGAGGYNVGLKEACKYDYKYFWLMDDDCIVDKYSLDRLLDADDKLGGKWSFLSSKALWIDGSICKTNIQRRRVARKIKDFKSPLVNVDYASFVSLLIKKEDVIKYGLPIKDFYIWTDDLEYTRRLSLGTRLSGYLINESIVTHKCKENIGVDISKDSNDRLDRYKYIYRNDVYTFKREGIRGYLFLFFRLIYHILKVIFRHRCIIQKLEIIINGYMEGLGFEPDIEYV